MKKYRNSFTKTASRPKRMKNNTFGRLPKPPELPWRHLCLTPDLKLLFDREDEHFVLQYKWYPIKRRHTWYAAARFTKNGVRHTILFHRLVMDCPAHLLTHHRNENGLDCRKHNLIKCKRQRHEVLHRRCYGYSKNNT